ncbi:MAG: methyltransferase domain-containing protein [Lentimicrobium sp.]|uniref:class I SAM-dependent methyltransferase n=2 Tax=Lentimicrobium sp. TaxID=2034841 RepID=UPI0025F19E8C|nr:methyltransferase domain-containing protein [Lentimicrobium sp.]MCO5256888.1 methyltransferase domain-containing protein [Lentimicrobium sp.]HPF64795.1 methyltransferase domain-containing protein [Lentimicrobium sp.]HPR26110.1 methyltransferase domain-containing protein [Lentimicrobium sp.]HRW69437.1 methyltransferase domain-containing protein [Lentimicrobium sp.]
MEKSKGLLGQKYSDDRKKKPELQFRLSVRARIVAYAVNKYLSSTMGLNVLDLGAAEGRTLMEMSRILPGNEFSGIEYSRELFNAAIPLTGNIKLQYGDITRLPQNLQSGSFDVVSALAVLEHLENPLDAVKESIRVLKPGGILVATCPVPAWDHISNKLGLLKEDHHETEMTRQLMIRIINDSGINLLEYRKFMWAPVSFLPYLHLPVSAQFSLKTDQWIAQLSILNWLFVNQVVIGRKPS